MKATPQWFNDLFANYVGQEPAKKILRHFLWKRLETRLMPHLIILAAKGQGKSTIAYEIAMGMVLLDENCVIQYKEDGVTPRKKKFVEINAASIKNLNAFMLMMVKYVQDQDVTVFIDEASELPHDVSHAMLTMLNPNKEQKSRFVQEDYVLELDFKRQTFILATAEVQKVNHMLIDRLERIELVEYSLPELSRIVQLCAPDVTFKDNITDEMATVLRGNARAGQKLANHVLSYLGTKTTFGKKDWENMKDIFGILPLGVSPLELSLLRYLYQNPQGVSLTRLHARTGMSKDLVQKDIEIYLQKLGMMEITTSGREITSFGIDYLRALDGNQKATLVGKPVIGVSAKVDFPTTK